MAEQHERYEQLAVGHVLGGLGSAESADFRSHLLDCVACRTRVAELRGIATDLEAAERDERARARLRTEVPQRAEPDEVVADSGGRVTIRHVTFAAVLVFVLAGSMAFWNLHLRTGLAAREAVAEAYSDALRHLANGEPLPATFGEGITGLVATDGDRLAVSLVGVEDVQPGESLVLWVLAPDGDATADGAVVAGPGSRDRGLLAGVTRLTGDGEVMVITRERGTPGREPAGDVLVRADLQRSLATD